MNIERLAQDIFRAHCDQLPTRKDIYRTLANTTVYSGEIDQALTWFKRNGFADFDSRRVNDPIRFKKKGSAP